MIVFALNLPLLWHLYFSSIQKNKVIWPHFGGRDYHSTHAYPSLTVHTQLQPSWVRHVAYNNNKFKPISLRKSQKRYNVYLLRFSLLLWSVSQSVSHLVHPTAIHLFSALSNERFLWWFALAMAVKSQIKRIPTSVCLYVCMCARLSCTIVIIMKPTLHCVLCVLLPFEYLWRFITILREAVTPCHWKNHETVLSL